MVCLIAILAHGMQIGAAISAFVPVDKVNRTAIKAGEKGFRGITWQSESDIGQTPRDCGF
jgi:hypothetical protein